jgi:hypothetical protein
MGPYGPVVVDTVPVSSSLPSPSFFPLVLLQYIVTTTAVVSICMWNWYSHINEYNDYDSLPLLTVKNAEMLLLRNHHDGVIAHGN